MGHLLSSKNRFVLDKIFKNFGQICNLNKNQKLNNKNQKLNTKNQKLNNKNQKLNNK